MLKILSYNIHFGRKTQEVLAWLAQENFDIMCLQEFPEKYLILLQELLSHYNYEFVTSIRWDKEYGQVTLYKKDNIQRLSSKKFLVSNSNIKKLLMGYGENRHALLTRFVYNKKQFCLINAHLTPIALNKRRILELERILEEIVDEPVIILGDLNYTSLLPREKLFAFMERHGFINSTKGILTHKLLGVRQQLDYIFAKNIKLKHVQVLEKTYSDHKPISAEAEVE